MRGTGSGRGGGQRSGAPPAFGKAGSHAQSRRAPLGSARTSHERAFLVCQGGHGVFRIPGHCRGGIAGFPSSPWRRKRAPSEAFNCGGKIRAPVEPLKASATFAVGTTEATSPLAFRILSTPTAPPV